MLFFFFFSSRRRHTRFDCDWSSDVCSSDLAATPPGGVTVKSLVVLATVPVGNPPPMVIVWGLGFRANGLPDTSPRNNCRSEERRVGKECRSRWSPYH